MVIKRPPRVDVGPWSKHVTVEAMHTKARNSIMNDEVDAQNNFPLILLLCKIQFQAYADVLNFGD